MKTVWVDQAKLTFVEFHRGWPMRQVLTGVDRYRGTPIEAEVQYSAGFKVSGIGEYGRHRVFSSIVGRDGVRYILGKRGHE